MSCRSGGFQTRLSLAVPLFSSSPRSLSPTLIGERGSRLGARASRPHPRSRQRPPPFSSSMVSVATGMANCNENSLQRPVFVFAMKIAPGAAFQTGSVIPAHHPSSPRRRGPRLGARASPLASSLSPKAAAIFVLLCGLRKAIVIPSAPRLSVLSFRAREAQPRNLKACECDRPSKRRTSRHSSGPRW